MINKKKKTMVPTKKGTDFTVKFNNEFIFRNISLILSIALVLSLFTNFCVVNSSEYGYGNDLALTGFNVLLGSQFTDDTYVTGGFFGLNLWNLVYHLQQLASIKKLMLFLAPLAGLIATFIAERMIASGLNASASAIMGYYLYLIISIAMIVFGFLQYQNISLSKDGVMEYVNKRTEKK